MLRYVIPDILQASPQFGLKLQYGSRICITGTQLQLTGCPLGGRCRQPTIIQTFNSLTNVSMSNGVVPDTSVTFAVAAAQSHCWPHASHVEKPFRVQSVVHALENAKLTCAHLPDKVQQISSYQPASPQVLQLVHTPEYVQAIAAYKELKEAQAIADFDVLDEQTYVTSSTYHDATLAVGAAVEVVDAIMGKGSENKDVNSVGHSMHSSRAGFVICRPPGHHALPSQAMGFCIFNNVAIVARHVQRQHGVDKVMIVDFDVHHGNGTHDIFYNDPSVLFVDMHQLNVWPGSGQATEKGADEGDGYTLNIPLPRGSGDHAAKMAMEQLIWPMAQRFRPEVLLVSAGFDAHHADPLEQLAFNSSTYHFLGQQLTRIAQTFCGGRVVFFLEGGYNCDALGQSVAECVRGILGLPSEMEEADRQLPMVEPLDDVKRAISEVKSIHGLN